VTARDEEDAPIAVIGLGSVLLTDDGFGPNVIELLRAGWDFPDGVAIVDAGTPGLALAGYLHRREVVILVDTVAATGAPGELRAYRGEELRMLPMKPRVNPHDPAVQEALWIADLGGRGPRDISLIGVIPASTEPGTSLTARVQPAVTTAAERVIAQLEASGIKARRRPTPRASQAWWNAAPPH
jgi:hydrogenase maturation protease